MGGGGGVLGQQMMYMCVCQVIRVLGLLGALDPHKHRMNMGQDQASEAAVSKSEKKPEEGGKDDCWLSLRVACVTLCDFSCR